MTDQIEPKLRGNRRMFLRGSAVAAVAVPLASKGAVAETLRQPTDHQVPARYQDSDHAQRFYALNRR